ncbi:MAG: GGDEF domain-containing protein [Thermoleophilia bacterium]|nr:GGDEF domain-containing protein [Thermoleophilia bacterium]
MIRLHRLAGLLADGDLPRARRATGVLLNLIVGATATAVAVLEGGPRLDLLAAAVAMGVAQVLVLLIRVPADGDWALLTILQALAIAVTTLSLTGDQDALVPLLAVNVAWAAVMLPTWIVVLSAVWSTAALAAPLAPPAMWDDPPGGYSLSQLVTGAVALAVVALISRSLASALMDSRARSDFESRTDALTGLFNRRHTAEALIAETRLAARTERPCAVLLVDVDHFKRVNDTYGHAVGDEVLVAVARRIVARARSGDVATRWGGEEFLLLARDVPDQATLAAICEDVRTSCRGTIRVAGGIDIPITVSVGGALSTNFPTPDTLVEAADRSLYEAKESGRDRSHVAGMAQLLG